MMGIQELTAFNPLHRDNNLCKCPSGNQGRPTRAEEVDFAAWTCMALCSMQKLSYLGTYRESQRGR